MKWFGDEPGSLTVSEVRLYAVLLLHAYPGDEISQWLSDVVSKERSADSKNALLWALSRRNETVLEIAGFVLEKLDGPGQTAIKATRSNLVDYPESLKCQPRADHFAAPRGRQERVVSRRASDTQPATSQFC